MRAMPRVSRNTAALEIRAFGELTILWGEQAAVLPASRKTKALLGYLLTTRVAHTREHLCDLLWEGPADPRAELRWSLTKIRGLLEVDGKRRLEADREHVRFEANGVSSDVSAFETLLAAEPSGTSLEALTQAVGLFRGPFLAGLDLADCRHFHLWLIAQRDQYRARYLDGLAELVRRLRERPADALPHARTLVAMDPDSDAGHVFVIELLAALGRKREALEHYEAHRKTLERDTNARPSPAIEQARALLVKGARQSVSVAPLVEKLEPVPPAASAKGPRLVGREAELAMIDEAVRASVSGAAQPVLMLMGQAGIGKSRLLEQVAVRMQAAAGTVVAGRGFEAEMTRPYGAWVDALRALAPSSETAARFPDLTMLLPELGRTASETRDRNRLFDAALGFLTHLAESSPLLIALDDVHWLDEGSAALLHYAARQLRGHRVLFACAARPGELMSNAPAWRAWRALALDPGSQALTIGPLDAVKTAELARAVAPDVDADRVFSESQGNSLFTLEVARALAERGTCLSDTLEGVIGDRLAGLGDTGRTLVAWAACMGARIDLKILAAVSGCPAGDVLNAVDDLERRAILRVSAGDAYDFAHDLIRQVAYHQIAEPRRRLSHGEIARQLSQAAEQDIARAVEVAHHADLGAVHELAVHAAVKAGELCLGVFANTEAIAVARRGLAHLEHLEAAARIGLRVSLLAVMAQAGLSNWRSRMPELADELEVAVHEAHQAADYEAATRGRFALSMMHERDEGRAHEESLLGAEDARAATPTFAARQLASAAQCLAHIQRDIGRARTMLGDAQRLAFELGLELGNMETGLGLVALWDGESDSARKHLTRGLEIVRRERDRYMECKCLIYLARLELEHDNPEQALNHCRELMPVASGMGEQYEAPLALVLEALANVALGASEADARLAQALEALQEIDAQAALAYALNAAALFDLRAGRLQSANRRAEQAVRAAKRVGRKTEIAFARALLAEVALAEGRLAAARAEVESMLAEVGDRDGLDARTRNALRAVARQLEIEVPAVDLHVN